MPRRSHSHIVSRAPCSNGRVSSAHTGGRRPCFERGRARRRARCRSRRTRAHRCCSASAPRPRPARARHRARRSAGCGATSSAAIASAVASAACGPPCSYAASARSTPHAEVHRGRARPARCAAPPHAHLALRPAMCAPRARRRTRRPRPARARPARRASTIASIKRVDVAAVEEPHAARQRPLVDACAPRRGATRSSAGSARRLGTACAIRVGRPSCGFVRSSSDRSRPLTPSTQKSPSSSCVRIQNCSSRIASSTLAATSSGGIPFSIKPRSSAAASRDRRPRLPPASAPDGSDALSAMFVLTHPGTAPRPSRAAPSSRARGAASPRSRRRRASHALYGPMNGAATSPATDAVFTMCAFGLLHEQRHERTHAVDHAPQVDAEHPLPRVSGISHDSPPPPTPALLQKMCTPPNRSTAASASACICAGSVTSVTTPFDLRARRAELGDRSVRARRLRRRR